MCYSKLSFLLRCLIHHHTKTIRVLEKAVQRYTFVGNYTTFSIILAVFVDYFREKTAEIQFFCITLQAIETALRQKNMKE